MKELLTETIYFKATADPALFVQRTCLDCATLIPERRDSIGPTLCTLSDHAVAAYSSSFLWGDPGNAIELYSACVTDFGNAR